jgi:hypothetical protein
VTNGLVLEIQRDALDKDVPVSTLLRKVRLAAAKLQLTKVEEWVAQELNGYDKDDLPDYRQSRGTVKAWNPYHGWQPVGGDATFLEAASGVQISESIASIEAALNAKSGGGSLHMPYGPNQLEALSNLTGRTIARAGIDFSSGALAHVMDAVRNLVLDWAIELEKSGVVGEGISFSPDEKKIAATNPVAIHVGTITNFTGNLGVGNTSGDITNAPINAQEVKNLVTQIKSHAKELIKEGVEPQALEAALNLIDKQLSTKKHTLIREALAELEKIVAKASGGLIAHGVLALLHQIIGTGVPT